MKCRSCNQDSLKQIVSFGQTPLANRLLAKEQLAEREPLFPLDLVFCPHCALVQITETVPPDVLFSEYLYFSSFSDTAIQNAQTIVQEVIASQWVDRDGLAVEIASNDGYLLQFYKNQGIPVLGIEPARNIAKVANEKGIDTLCEFFTPPIAEILCQQGKQADVIHANNVLAHVADLNGFVEAVSILLKDTGLALIEFPYLQDLIEHCEFDTIYHEHLCYFSLTAIVPLFARHGLTVFHVERLAIHGGSLRLYVGKNRLVTRTVQQMLGDEQASGIPSWDYYCSFVEHINSLKKDLRQLLTDLKREKKTIVAYGASAKGSTLLNYFSIGSEYLDYVVDRSTVKQGLYTPGTHLPILDPSFLLKDQPDYTLLLTWNFADEILKQQEIYRQKGGHFILPIPKVQIV